jgi:hypothetical protein
MKRSLILESEKKEILSKHIKTPPINLKEVVISEWLSPDERYIIFLDELYDIKNKTKLGDIWKSPDNLILFLEHTFRVSKLKKDIKEHAQNTFNNILLTENVQDMSEIKPIIKQFLIEGGFWDTIGSGLNYAGKFVKDSLVDAGTGLYNFGKDLVVGGAKLGKAVLSGEWAEVFDLMKKGIKWLARKIRSAVYTPVGIVIDAILVATGYGKVPQVVVWAIIVCLDIYEFVTGDYEDKNDSMLIRILFFLCDILGLVFAGIAAKAARVAVRAAILSGDILLTASKPTLKSILVKMVSALKELPAKLSSIGSYLAKGQFGALFKMAISKVNSFIKWIIETLKSSLKSKELRSVLVTAGIVTGIGTGMEYYKDFKKEKNEKQKIDQEKLNVKQKEEEEELVIKAVSDKKLDYSTYL